MFNVVSNTAVACFMQLHIFSCLHIQLLELLAGLLATLTPSEVTWQQQSQQHEASDASADPSATPHLMHFESISSTLLDGCIYVTCAISFSPSCRHSARCCSSTLCNIHQQTEAHCKQDAAVMMQDAAVTITNPASEQESALLVGFNSGHDGWMQRWFIQHVAKAGSSLTCCLEAECVMYESSEQVICLALLVPNGSLFCTHAGAVCSMHGPMRFIALYPLLLVWWQHKLPCTPAA